MCVFLCGMGVLLILISTFAAIHIGSCEYGLLFATINLISQCLYTFADMIDILWRLCIYMIITMNNMSWSNNLPLLVLKTVSFNV
jgi:hypothetical protein